MPYLFFGLLLIQVILSIIFYRKQNRGDFVGGPISWAKAFWLYHAIFSWYLVPLVFLLHPEVHSSLKWVIGVHSLIWWLRGPLELFMIYKFFNWTPRYGISHDVIHNLLLLLGLAVTVKAWDASLVNAMAFAYGIVTVIMLSFETWFAALFLQVRGDSDHKIYYAADEPKWIFINRLTIFALVIGIGHALIQATLAALYW